MNPFKALLSSRKVWVAVVAFGVVVVQRYLPTIPKEVVDAAVQLGMVVIAGITIEDAAQKFGAAKQDDSTAAK